MSSIFIETSALLRLLFGEQGGDFVSERLRNADRALASRLIRLEAERALIRLAVDYPRKHSQIMEIERDLKFLWPRLDFIEITRDICELAGRIAPRSRLRSLDAIHLATYFRVKELDPNIEMLSFDERITSEV